MEIWQAVILGIVQGATEYLPVSSSGHLVLVPMLLGFEKASFEFDVLVQLGTLLAVLIYFAKDLWQVLIASLRSIKNMNPLETTESKFGWFVIVATFPAGILGLLFKDTFEQAFSSTLFTGFALFVTAALLLLGEALGKRTKTDEDMTLLDAIAIGFAQALALFPGVSRSGSTISIAMLRGLDRDTAARFSFVMSIPVMLGAGILALKDLWGHQEQLAAEGPAIAVGFVVSAITGFIAIKWFLGFIKSKSLKWFAFYCIIVGMVAVVTSLT